MKFANSAITCINCIRCKTKCKVKSHPLFRFPDSIEGADAPFHVLDAQEHKENGVYMIGKKDHQEVAVDLCFKETDLEQ